MTCKRQLEEHTDQIGLKKEDAIDRAKWRDGVYELSRRIRRIWPPALTQKKTGFKKVDLSLSLSFSTGAEKAMQARNVSIATT